MFLSRLTAAQIETRNNFNNNQGNCMSDVSCIDHFACSSMFHLTIDAEFEGSREVEQRIIAAQFVLFFIKLYIFLVL